MQQCTHSNNTGSGPFCTQCGERLTPQPVFKPVKKSLLTSTNVIIAFFVAVAGFVIFAIFADSMSSTVDNISSDFATDIAISNTPSMTATVKIMPGGIMVYNEDTFPWYGLIINLKDGFSTKYRFNDSDWPGLRADSVVLPNEETGGSITAYIDRNGNEYEGQLYTILATDVTLEAKSEVDGPYDLKANFYFSRSYYDELVIVDHGVWLTNKPTKGDAPATPYVLTTAPERKPSIRIYPSPQPPEDGTGFIWLRHHEPKYDEVMAVATPYHDTVFDSAVLPLEEYRKVEAILGTAPALSEQEQEALNLWQEQWEHWENVDAFQGNTTSISEDRIIDKEESQRICSALDQWTAQMTDAITYVQDYRKVDPQTVEKNPGLGNLESEASRALELLNQIECE